MVETEGPLFSLVSGEGSGALLAAVAGDVAGGRNTLGYSALTQQATVVAYQLMKHARIDRDDLAKDLVELRGDDGEYVLVYRGMSEQFGEWLEATYRGEAAATAEPSAEPAVRCIPIGVWFRQDPDQLVEAAVEAARITNIDATSVAASVVMAGAVASGSFAQNGRDLVDAAGEVAELARARIAEDPYRFSRVEELGGFVRKLRAAARLVGRPIDPAQRELGIGDEPGPGEMVTLALLLAGPVEKEAFRQIERGAVLGGSVLGAMVGGIVGARVGLRVWPWVIANDTWFAEIGRRLVRHHREYRDLPVPYSVEERITLGITTEVY
jgi:ADP-ribosylglycohydrolase